MAREGTQSQDKAKVEENGLEVIVRGEKNDFLFQHYTFGILLGFLSNHIRSSVILLLPVSCKYNSLLCQMCSVFSHILFFTLHWLYFTC